MNAAEVLHRIREERPLVHHITNYVTVNLVANVTLSTGALPVMAHAREEVEEMASLASALVLNIGTLDPGQIEAMLLAGERANRRGVPVVLDPVGAGATSLRTRAAERLLSELEVSA
ncbi:MAG: hydroxyethylthiazole kinase, partial [Actinomycetota bacterium]|nr:hydroxyethylthiazole kinase [Actinomycetota bacterium]